MLCKFFEIMDEIGGVASLSWNYFVKINSQMAVKSKEMTAFLTKSAQEAGTSWEKAVKGITYQFDGLADKIKDVQTKIDDIKGKDEPSEGDDAELAKLTGEMNDLLAEQKTHAGGAANAMRRLGPTILATFNAAQASGLGWAATMEALQPALAALVKGYDDLGIKSDSTAVNELIAMQAMYDKNKSLFDAIDANTQGMIALSRLGGLTAETFDGITAQVTDLFRITQGEVEKMGGTHKDALRPFVGFLAQAEADAKKYGYQLDATTQQMLDQARELGLLGPTALTQSEIMEAGFDKVDASIQRMILSLDAAGAG